MVFGFPLFGLGVILGAVWAESAWGRFWGWDPKETVSFIAWVIYAAYLHARATVGWKHTAAAWVNVARLRGAAVQPLHHQPGGIGPPQLRGIVRAGRRRPRW